MKDFFKKHVFNLIMFLVFVAGLAMVAYPTISDYLNSKVQTKAISDYKHVISTGKDIQNIKNAAILYNQALYGSQSSGTPISKTILDYNEVLNLTGNGIMGYIDIPVISVELPIYHGTEDRILQVAVGHAEGSSVPIGGENTHAVLLGHRGLPTASLFNNLDQLNVGDYFEIHVLDEVLCYEVDKIEIVLPQELNKIRIKSGEDRVTLVTCTPYGINTHRLLVHGKRIDNSEVQKLITSEARKINPAYCAAVSGMILWICTMVIVFVIYSHRRTKELTREENLRRRLILDKYSKK